MEKILFIQCACEKRKCSKLQKQTGIKDVQPRRSGVQKGKAKILKERCIDCGECIRVCPYSCKKAVTDPLSSISDFKYKIALPAWRRFLYAQFKMLGHEDI